MSPFIYFVLDFSKSASFMEEFRKKQEKNRNSELPKWSVSRSTDRKMTTTIFSRPLVFCRTSSHRRSTALFFIFAIFCIPRVFHGKSSAAIWKIFSALEYFLPTFWSMHIFRASYFSSFSTFDRFQKTSCQDAFLCCFELLRTVLIEWLSRR